MSNTLGTLLDDFTETDREVLSHLTKMEANFGQAYAAEKAFRRLQRRTRTDLQTIDLDNVTSFNHHVRLLDLQNECIKREIEGNAETRLVFAKLDKLAILETDIIANHSSELQETPTEMREWFAKRREIIAGTRMDFSEIYRTMLFQEL
ncbi:hypothetical protein KCU77_g1386, partial [Aureobasidium melanogenum]